MSDTKTFEVCCMQYELEIPVNAPRERLWAALIDETNAWWLGDFHMVGEGSTVEFDLTPGGRGLVEYKEGGGFLIWFSVQFYMPDQFAIHMVGNLGPDWGGPSTTNLKLSVEETSSGSVLKISDSHHGRVSEDSIASLKSGWLQLFTDGLAKYVEEPEA